MDDPLGVDPLGVMAGRRGGSLFTMARPPLARPPLLPHASRLLCHLRGHLVHRRVGVRFFIQCGGGFACAQCTGGASRVRGILAIAQPSHRMCCPFNLEPLGTAWNRFYPQPLPLPPSRSRSRSPSRSPSPSRPRARHPSRSRSRRQLRRRSPKVRLVPACLLCPTTRVTLWNSTDLPSCLPASFAHLRSGHQPQDGCRVDPCAGLPSRGPGWAACGSGRVRRRTGVLPESWY